MPSKKVSNGEGVRKSAGKPDFEKVKFEFRPNEISFLTTLKQFLDYSKNESFNEHPDGKDESLRVFYLSCQFAGIARARLWKTWKAYRPKGLDGCTPTDGVQALTGIQLWGFEGFRQALFDGGKGYRAHRLHLVRWKLVQAGWLTESGELTPLAQEWMHECMEGIRQDIDRLLLACGYVPGSGSGSGSSV